MAGKNLTIKNVELKNFRQYEDVLIDFSQDQKKSFTIIEGNNSTGKTSLINAMYWCLYEKEEFLNEGEGKPIPNQNILNATKVGDACESSVTITINDDQGPKYQITRNLDCKRTTDEREKDFDSDAAGQIDSGFSTFITQSFKQRSSDGSWDSTDDSSRFLDKVTTFLPEKLASFVIFNGEMLDSFFKDENSGKIKDGIEKVSGLPVTERSIDHWKTILKLYSSRAAKSSGTTTRIDQDKLESKTTTLEKIEKGLGIGHSNMTEYEQNIKQLEMTMAAHPLKAYEILQGQLHSEKINREQFDKFVVGQKDHRMTYITDNFAQTLLKDATEHTFNLLKESEIKGETPPPIKKFFVDELIKHKECICGTKFNETSNEMNYLEELRDKVKNSPLINISYEGKETLTNMIETMNSKEILEKLDELRQKEEEYGLAYREAKEKVNGTIEKLKEYDEKDIRKTATNLDSMRHAKETLNQELTLKEAQKQALQSEIQDLDAKISRVTGTTDAAKKWIQKKDLADKAHCILNQIREELLTDIREKVQNRTEEIFKKLITRNWQIDRIEIDENYKIRVIDTEQVNNLKTLSAGQTLYLALSYIAAVREVTDTNYPMIIDSPFGKVSGQERVSAAKDLPIYLPDTQITLLVTNTEYNAEIIKDTKTGKPIESIQKILQKNGRIGKAMRLEMEKISDTSSRTIVKEA